MIPADLQSLTPGNIVTLFTLDTTAIGGTDVFRFHDGVNKLGNTLVWQGSPYVKFPIEASGFERTGSGSLPRPKLVVANIDGLISQIARLLGGLEGAKLTRVRTFLKYLDAVNFPGGVNPTADGGQYIERDVWYIARRTAENKIFLEYELAASFDLAGIRLPRRQVIQNVCTWKYRSAECGYAGGPVAKITDEPTSDPLLDRCGKRLGSCELRFGVNQPLNFGGFPGAGLTR
jgi:lambda family phage minor tail protein L